MSSLLERAVKNTTWSSGGAVTIGVVGFILSAATIRLLGLTEAGFAAAVLALSSVAGTVGGLGLGTGLIREVSRTRAAGDSEACKRVIGLGLLVALISGSLGFSGLLIFSESIVAWTGHFGTDGDDILYCRIAGFTFLVSQVSSSLQAPLEGDQRYDLRAVVLVGSLVGQTMVTVIFLSLSPSLLALGSIQLLFAGVRMTGFYFLCSRVFGAWPVPKWSLITFRRIWGFSRWIYAGGLLSILSSGLDRVAIVFIFGSTVLPIYVLSRRFYELGHDILVGQAGFLLPLLSGREEAGQRRPDLDDRLRWFVASLAGLLCFGVLVFGPSLVAVLISPDFAVQSRWGILVFALIGYCHAQAIVPFFSAQARGDSRATFLFQLMGGVCVLPAMFLLGRLFGFAGAVSGQGVIAVVALGFTYLQTLPSGSPRVVRMIRPLSWPTGLLSIAVALYGLWLSEFLSLWMLTVVGSFGIALYFPILCRLEGTASDRVDTLRRALGLVSARVLGITWIVRFITGPSRGAAERPLGPAYR